MSCKMYVYTMLDAGTLCGFFQHFHQCACRVLLAGSIALEQPFLRTVFLEIFPKLVQHLFRQQRVTAFLTLAHDAYQHPFTDNVLWGEVQQFAPSQTGGIDQGNHAVMFPVRQAGEDAFDLVPAQHFG